MAARNIWQCPTIRSIVIIQNESKYKKFVVPNFLKRQSKPQPQQQKEMSQIPAFVTNIQYNLVLPTSGSIVHQSTPSQLILFSLTDTGQINNILTPTFGGVSASEISFTLNTTVTAIEGATASSTQHSTALSVDYLNNPTQNPQIQTADFNTNYQNSYDVTWSENVASITGIPTQVNLFDSSGNLLLQISQGWNSINSNVVPQSFQISQSIEVPSNSQMQAILQADIVTKNFIVYYQASLSGYIVSTFNQPVGGQTTWNTAVSPFQCIANFPTYVVATQNITLTLYENPRITFRPYNPN